MFEEKKFTKCLIKAAIDANFYGKRLRDKKLELVENFRPFLVGQFGLSVPEVGDLVDWLDDNRPRKKLAKRAASNKLAFDHESGSLVGETEKKIRATGDCFILTTAQNNTPLVPEFLDALEVYAQYLNAQIMISPTEYNKTAYTREDEKIYYNPRVMPYLVDKPVQLYDDLVFAAELMINPTRTRPTNSRAGYHGNNSLIVPHVKVELQSLPTAQNELPKFVYSTGCITVKNYIQRDAGQKAESTHCISALIVEPCILAGKKWQVRQLHWHVENGSFIDLNNEVSPNGVTDAPPASAISLGDIHAEKIDRVALENALFLAHRIKARNVFAHDFFDFTSKNHHNIGDPWHTAKYFDHAVTDDLKCVSSVLDLIAENVPLADKIHIVRSNHDEALDRWLVDRKYDFRSDPVNSQLYLALQATAYGLIHEGKKVPDMLEIALNVADLPIPENVDFLTRKSVVKIDGVILSDHGDCGANGSRATPIQLARTYDKMTSGHTHSCAIYDGVYVSGVTGSLYMGYNEKGASSWSHSHTVQYANGYRAIITY